MQILFFPIMTITSMTTTTSMTSAVSCCEHKSNFIYVFNRKLRLTITAAVSASVSISASMTTSVTITSSVTFILRVYINYKTKFYKFLLPPYRCPASAANKTALMINNPKSKAITDFIFT